VAITFVYESWGGYPVIQCDWCSKQIKDVEEGNVYWLHDDPSGLYFNHKRCALDHDTALEEVAREHDTTLLSEHLEVFLAQLLGNSGRADAMSVVDKERLYETRGH
jgi:hypothetical protein